MPFSIPKVARIGFERYAADEPVMAKTTIMTKTCQLDFIFQRSLKLAIINIYTNILVY